MKNGAVKKQKRRSRKEVLDRFGRYLSRRRGRKRLSIRQFALQAKMPYSNIHQIEQCKKNPRLTELIKLADAFKETLPEFLRYAVRR